MLFNKRLLQTHLNNFEFPQEYDFDRANKIISTWQKAIKDGNYDKTKETQVQSSFLYYFFHIVLGYTEMHDSPDAWNLHNEAKTDVDSTRADGALGFFTKDESQNITRVVIELKDAKTALDKKQSSRKDYDSPISQAFSYSSKFDRCDWIIVSNFKEIRIYHKDRGQGYYESFEILDLDNDKEFKRFYFLLCKENLIDKDRNSLLDKLVKDTSKNEDDISKKFYKDFKALRQELFIHICENNPDVDKKCILEKTQKLLDRLIFIMFCEDSGNLLPINTLRNYFETGKNLPMPNDDKIWQIIRGLFISIDKGNSEIKPPINKYNGGLFAYDTILDNLFIKDDIWESVIQLANYDFESDLNVNILGHIFEQSLSDLEQIKAEIDGIEQDKTKSKRKKDGIFYTPEYITRYIVEQTVGKYLEENPDKLESIKILDPACGSGAFINQAHTFLKEQYKIRTEEIIANERSSKRGGEEFLALNLFKHTNIAETDRSILLNNLYGVDLNEESTEITKLALWLKTAKKDQPLQNLDNNIKSGNSLIDVPEIAGVKAFKWEEEFKDIMGNGGFDCIIGNPPYVQIFDEKVKNQLEKSYNSFRVNNNLYVAFIQKSIEILKVGGYLGLIVPNTFIKGASFELLRTILADFNIIEIVDFGSKIIFEDATVFSSIIVLQKTQPKTNEWQLYSDIGNLKGVVNAKQTEFLAENHILLKLAEFSTFDNYFLVKDVGYNYWSIGRGKVRGDSIGSRVLYEGNPLSEKDTPYIKGSNIFKYYISEPYNFLRHNYSEFLNENDIFRFSPDILEKKEKIVYRQTSSKLVGALELNSYHNDKTVHLIIPRDNINVELKSVLCMFNSKLLAYCYNAMTEESGQAFAQVKTINVKKLPFIIPTQEQQTSLANKAEQMIALNKQLHEGVNSALDLLQAEYQPKKISQKLEKFYTLGQHPFLEELSKQGVKLDLSQKEELLQWYKQKSETLSALKTQIDQLDHTIDQEVYQLYNLTPEEIQIIEES